MPSKIEWTTETWNPTTGCDQVSPGCDHCYALTMSARLKAMGQPKYQTDGRPETSGPGFGVATHPETLEEPLRWRKPRRVFVDSMSDLFHPGVPSAFIGAVFDVMRRTPQHTYQILTKRPQRMRSLSRGATFGEGWPLPNVWLGISVEDQRRGNERIPELLDTPAAVRFVSCEPLLGPVDLYRNGWEGYLPSVAFGTDGSQARPEDGGLAGSIAQLYRDLDGPRLDWVIVGGESGPNARPMHPDWVRSVRDQCNRSGVPFFFKQWGAWAPPDPRSGVHPGDICMSPDGFVDTADDDYVCFANESEGTLMRRVGGHGGRELDGRTWDEFPDQPREAT